MSESIFEGESPATVFARLDAELEVVAEIRSALEGLDAAARSRARARPAPDLCVAVVSAARDLPDVTHPFWGRVAVAIRSRLGSAGCDLLVFSSRLTRGSGESSFAAFAARARRRGVDGMIVAGLDGSEPELIAAAGSELPAIFIDHHPIADRVGSVMSDNVGGMESAVLHLARLGRRRIAHLAGTASAHTTRERVLGYRNALARSGLPLEQEYLRWGDFFHRSGLQLTQELLALPQRPDAIAAASDMMAVGAMVALQQAGLRIPDDVAVTGFDDNALAAQVVPGLTTVRQDATAMGIAAAEGILRMIGHPEEMPPVVVVPTSLVVRESCGIELPSPTPPRPQRARILQRIRRR